MAATMISRCFQTVTFRHVNTRTNTLANYQNVIFTTSILPSSIRCQQKEQQYQQQQRRTMAGHNKWSKIKHKKAANDVARLKAFSKATRAIIVAGRACGGDMDDVQFQSCIDRAKKLQVPKDRIQSAIDKATGNAKNNSDESSKNLVHIRYDAMLNIDGVKIACIVTALSDNRNRTFPNVRTIITKAGSGEMLPTSNLNYLFRHAGVVLVNSCDSEDDAFLECTLDAGATDVDFDDENRSAMITCEPADLWNLVSALKAGGYETEEFEHRYLPESNVSISHENQEKLDILLEKLDDDEDITNVYHNAVIE